MKGKNDYFKPLFWILGFLTLLLAQGTQALDKAPSIFYPLPAQAQGKIFAAQNLFLGEEGEFGYTMCMAKWFSLMDKTSFPGVAQCFHKRAKILPILITLFGRSLIMNFIELIPHKIAN
nr:hypothetical protein [Vibrio anguillarum]